MILTITNKSNPATDLGYLLHKNPARAHTVDLSFGSATVFYPEAHEDLCTACLVLDVDPLTAVPGRGQLAHLEAPYVNDRPYVASSLLSSAIHRVFGTALSGRCKHRPELVNQLLDLTLSIPVIHAHGGQRLLRRLFEPLGYLVEAEPLNGVCSDEAISDHGLFKLTISGHVTVRALLSHISLLIPVVDYQLHTWITLSDVSIALRRSQDWLPYHPDARLIIRRAFKNQWSLVQKALRLDPYLIEMGYGEIALVELSPEGSLEAELRPPRSPLADARYEAVEAVLEELGARHIVDLGCGSAKFTSRLAKLDWVEGVLGVDVSLHALAKAQALIDAPNFPRAARSKITLKQSSLLYKDSSVLSGDVGLLIEVIEHIDESRLETLESIVFGSSNYGAIIVTTPNREYNQFYDPSGILVMRHADHRFEWSRAEFVAWAQRVAEQFSFVLELRGIGDDDQFLGTPTQMAIFRRVKPGTGS